MKEETYTEHIDKNGTITVIDETVYLVALSLSVIDPGQTWTLTMQDRGTPPRVILSPVPMSPSTQVEGAPRTFTPPRPMILVNGLDIIAAGNTPGKIDAWITLQCANDA